MNRSDALGSTRVRQRATPKGENHTARLPFWKRPMAGDSRLPVAAALPRQSHHARHPLPRGAVVLDGGVGVTDAVGFRASHSHGWQYDRTIVPMPNTSAIRLYVYDLPAHFNDALLTCYAAESDGAYPWQDDLSHACTESTLICGQHKAQEVSQYAADVWLHRSLKSHST